MSQTDEDAHRLRMRNRYRRKHGIPLDAPPGEHFHGQTAPTLRLRPGDVRLRLRSMRG